MRLEDFKDQLDDIINGWKQLPEVFKDLVVAALAGGAGLIIGAWFF